MTHAEHGDRVRVKVCGLTRPEDVAVCHTLGVDFTGFIFVAASKRRIPPEAAAAMPRGRSARVGVFAGFSPAAVCDVMHRGELAFAQLHGGESRDFCQRIGPERVIKVLWPESMSRSDLQQELNHFAPACAYFLFDAGQKGGGSGSGFAAALLDGLSIPRPWLLAGGLGPDTLKDALAACSPFGVDLNSALETAPGIKDPRRVQTCVEICTMRCRPLPTDTNKTQRNHI